MDKLHQLLQTKSRHYQQWHQNEYHQHHHWLVVFVAFIFSFYVVAGAWQVSLDENQALVLNINSTVKAQTCTVGSPTGGNDASQIQAAIDSCSGGIVVLQNGATYTAGTIELKSNVTLDLNNATIEMTTDETQLRSCKGATSSRNFFICSDTASNVALVGPGSLVKTSGSDFDSSMVEFWNTSGITVQDVTIDSTAAPLSATGFHLITAAGDNVTFDGVTVRGRRGSGSALGNDGIDIQSSQNVTVSNCDVDTADDGIAIASSDGSGEETRDVTVTNCRVASDTAALKFGTGSAYNFDNITFDGVTVHNSPFGIRVAIVDGADVGNVTFRNLTFESTDTRWWVCGGGTGSDQDFGDKSCVRQIDRDGDGVLSPLGNLHDFTFDNIDIFGGATLSGDSRSEASINTIDRVSFFNVHYFDGSGTPPLTWFRDVCGLSISNITYPDPTVVPSSDYDQTSDTAVFQIDSDVTDLVVDGSAPTCAGVAPPTQDPVCSDGIDNDNDGLIDFPADPGCTDANDTSENDSTAPPQDPVCSDGIDNDNDGLIDFPADPGCTDANDTSEIDTPTGGGGNTTECTYYIANDGSDSNDGQSLSNPWQSIAKANQTLQPGDTVCLRGGTYDEVIEPYNSGTAGNKITYTNYQDENAIVRGVPDGVIVVSIGWKVNGNWDPKSYVVIDGLTIRGEYFTGYVDGFGYPRNVFVYGDQSGHNEIRNLTIIKEDPVGTVQKYGRMEYGIGVSKASNNIVENNYIEGMSRIGIIGGGSGRNNIFRNNTILNSYQSNIDIGSSHGEIQGTLIEGNILGVSIIEDGIQFENCYTCGYDETNKDLGSNRGTIVRNNIIYGAAENNIDLKGASLVIIEGNIMYGGTGNNDGSLGNDGNGDADDRTGGYGGIFTGASSVTDSRDIIVRNNVIYDNFSGVSARIGYKVYNNTVIGNNRDYTGPNSDWTWTRKPAFKGITVWQGHERVGIKNNIVGEHSTAEVSARSGAGLDINNNLYTNTNTVYFVDFRDNFDWNQLLFSDWQTHLANLGGIVGQDKDSFIADPMFVNAPARPVGDYSQFDFHLQSGSPAIDAGQFLTETTSAGSGTIMNVADAGYFTDGLGITEGDLIQLEGQDLTATITSIDYNSNTITLDSSLTWNANQGVSLAYSGSAPDIGAYDFGLASSGGSDGGDTGGGGTTSSCTGGGTAGLGGNQTPDLTNDGCVDDADLAILLSCWGYTSSTAPSNCLGDGSGGSGGGSGGDTGGGGGGSCTAGGSCTTSAGCPGTYVCVGDTQTCSDTPNDGCGDSVTGPRFDPTYPRTAVMHFGPTADNPPEWYAKFDMVDQRSSNEAVPQNIHALNPNSAVFGTTDWNFGSFSAPPPDEWRTYDSSGTALNIYNATNLFTVNPTDFASPAAAYGNQLYNEWLPGAMITEFIQDSSTCVDCFDGFATDGIWMRPRESEGGNCGGDIDLDYYSNPGSGNDYCTQSEDWVRSQWQAGWNDKVIAQLNTLSGDRPLILNSGRFHLESEGFDWSNHNGLILENIVGPDPGFFLNTYSDWMSIAREPHLLHMQVEGNSKTDYQDMRYHLGLAMYGDGYFSYSEEDLHHYDSYYDEYDLNLGYPTGAMQQLLSTNGNEGVWVRFFDNGAVILNATDASQTVTDAQIQALTGYAGPYYSFTGGQDPSANNGQQFNSITLAGGRDNSNRIRGDAILLTSQPTTMVTEIFVDNDDESTSPGSSPAEFSGIWTDSVDKSLLINPWTQSWKGQRSSYARWAMSYSDDSNASVTFRPEINLAGNYEIFEWHGGLSSGGACSQASLTINGQSQPSINQTINIGQWNSLGVFNLSSGTGNTVELDHPGGCTLIADAVVFVYQANAGDIDPKVAATASY